MSIVEKVLATCDRPEPSAIPSRYNTLLIRAALEGDLVECENLITNFGADVNEKGTNGMTCLHAACEKGSMALIKFFLERGIDINAQEDKESGGNTPLLISIKLGFNDATLFLLNNGADVDIADSNGATPLHIATMKGNLKIVQELLSRGANVERVDSGGKTAWYWAHALHYEEIQALLPEQKYNWLKYQESISPPAPKPKEDPKAKKGKKGKKGKK
ncbi:putative Ankyrin repeats (3 copies) [Monocercomonoides exilis]|uniref:putative Ankyrin repeats (3 copies) n=1 Tax=Monocercomonoides exilis TaxID=2049356 RepID=UPI0035594D33|nr:putative Ankyrin repeats (3 copies) [Monocercomonoides exilis]|eukprot:MONOS_1712.1-p1 / transcript=MONOS_1712.1 / gene=MONOS_1712 / organism=Monocercomonoides_exilis_PA203 / gene_product=Chain A, Crystal Structure Of Engineered Protein. Northeast Structural Genomics Consortium Target Or265. / transcript_product=Chain A, Crystal Structure Of Engineered Protein. Northeast Structural Genomics Consortium Target Or265. / location=Mono_scaffold00031:175221-176069(-) / protein_length=216 / sequence_SO=supercontig / SO=protein_coding / is_pseudo=false